MEQGLTAADTEIGAWCFGITVLATEWWLGTVSTGYLKLLRRQQPAPFLIRFINLLPHGAFLPTQVTRSKASAFYFLVDCKTQSLWRE
jgi:hypothetical protein